MLYNYCPKIPEIPSELIDITENEIRKIPNIFNGVTAKKYSLHAVTKELKNFLKPYFNSNVNIAFQLITGELPVHKDYGRTNCYNYIIKTGGDVDTVWYDNDLKEIERVNFSAYRWHNINVETFHNVIGVDSTRIAISVWSSDKSVIGEVKT